MQRHYFLFRPFDRKQWILPVSSASFWGAAPRPRRFNGASARFPSTFARRNCSACASVWPNTRAWRLWLPSLTLGVILGLIYIRCVLRFVLIDGVVKQHIAARAAWKDQKTRAQLFLWLIAVIGVLLAVGRAAGSSPFAFSIFERAAIRNGCFRSCSPWNL